MRNNGQYLQIIESLAARAKEIRIKLNWKLDK